MSVTNNPLLIPPVIPTPVPSSGRIPSTSLGAGQGSSAGTSAVAQCNLIWVKSIDELLNYPSSPNEQLYFGNEDELVLYVRETDGNGKVKSPIKALHYTIEEIPIGPEAQFVTKDEHKQLYDLVEKLSISVSSMDQKLEKLLDG